MHNMHAQTNKILRIALTNIVFILALKPLTNQRQPSVLGADEWRKEISLDNFDYEEQLVVLYNRVPKTGSTSFVNIAYDLCKRNRFHVLHINITANSHVLSLPNQVGDASKLLG